MIVGHSFQGDDDTDFAWTEQHVVYYQALGLIFSVLKERWRYAALIIGDAKHLFDLDITDCDHRDIQNIHDIFAAAYRFRINTRQVSLDFDRGNFSSPTKEDWLAWLEEECKRQEPYFVRLFIKLVSNKNHVHVPGLIGKLSLQLLDWYSEVPWNVDVVVSIQKDAELFVD